MTEEEKSNSYLTWDDGKIAETVNRSFGLFNGKDEVKVYAHFIPDAIDPDDKLCQDGEGTRLYFELFTDAILRSIIDDDSFVYEYGVVLECDSRSLDILHEYMFPQDYYDQKAKFFPISWREEDQTSNVKLTSQAANVLKMLGKYKLNQEFITTELRDRPIDKYTYQEIKRAKK